MNIALICPTRGRPDKFRRMLESARATATAGIETIHCYAAFTEGDASIPQYDVKSIQVLSHVTWPDYPTVHKWNMLAEWAMADSCNKFFMLAADDMIFSTRGWDAALREHYAALKNKIHVYALQDSRDKDGTPHPIVTREYIKAMGYFLPPIFLHWYVDSWTVRAAKENDYFTHLRDYLLIHDKPSDRGQPDETHTRIRSMGWHDRDKWVAEKCEYLLKVERMKLRCAIDGLEVHVIAAKTNHGGVELYPTVPLAKKME